MNKNIFRFALPSLLIFSFGLLIALSPAKENAPAGKENHPSRIILCVVDGMGMTHLNAAREKMGKKWVCNDFPVLGLHKPYSRNPYHPKLEELSRILATGSVDKQDSLNSLAVLAQQRGLGSAYITTGNVSNTMAGAMYTTEETFTDPLQVAEDLPEAPLDYLVGGGRNYMVNREDQKDILNWFAINGYRQFNKIKHFPKWMRGDKKLILLSDYQLEPAENDRGTLFQDVWESAFYHYAKKGSGYFMLIHQEHVAAASAQKSTEGVLAELDDLNKMLQHMQTYLNPAGGTLLVVMGLADKGGPVLVETNVNGEPLLKWSVEGYTGGFAPILAKGLGAERFAGIKTTHEIHQILREMLQQ